MKNEGGRLNEERKAKNEERMVERRAKRGMKNEGGMWLGIKN